MVRGEVDDHLDAVAVGGGDKVVKLGPGVAGIAEVFFDAFEVACLVAVIRSGGIAVAIGDIGVQGNTSDPLYHDAYKFANKSGISLLDFPLNTAIRNVFGSN